MDLPSGELTFMGWRFRYKPHGTEIIFTAVDPATPAEVFKELRVSLAQVRDHLLRTVPFENPQRATGTTMNYDELKQMAREIAEHGGPVSDLHVIILPLADGFHVLERGADGLYHELPKGPRLAEIMARWPPDGKEQPR